MPWRVAFEPTGHYVETTFAGLLTPDELKAAVMATLHECQSRNVPLLLADCSTLEGGHSIVDLYEMASAVAASAVVGHLREAVLVPASAVAADSVHFWETAAGNRGLTVQLFQDRESALSWLLG